MSLREFHRHRDRHDLSSFRFAPQASIDLVAMTLIVATLCAGAAIFGIW